jgi:phenylalanyl-tRNA synthetase alpha subunit
VEIGGSGMVHPNVLEYSDIDSKKTEKTLFKNENEQE